MKKSESGKAELLPAKRPDRVLRPSHYFVEPLPRGGGCRLRLIGQYVDTNEEIELGGGIFWTHNEEEAGNAYAEARAKGEGWIGAYHFLTEDPKRLTGFSQRVEQLVDQELRRNQSLRSEEYRQGMLDYLSAAIEAYLIPYRFSPGTPQCDAYLAGKDHASRFWWKLQTERKGVIEGQTVSVSRRKKRLPRNNISG